METDECLQPIEINLETIIYDSVLNDGLIKEEMVVAETEVAAEEEVDDSTEKEITFGDISCDVNRDHNEYGDNCSNSADTDDGSNLKSQIHEIIEIGTNEIKNNQNESIETNFKNQSNEKNFEIDNNNYETKSKEENFKNTKAKDSSSTYISAQDAWSHFTGLKIKQFTLQELNAFKKPFEMGWRREVVLRGTVTNSGKKIGDVYYFSPDKKVKLRSYIEMGSYLKKHPDCNLEPENFTFARQRIYKYPDEIVRHAMQRNHNQSSENKLSSTLLKQQQSQSPSIETNKSTSGIDSTTSDEIKSVAEGRAKRKRVAPTRFEDEDYSEQSPFKKKPKVEKLSQESIISSKQLQNKVINSNCGSSKSSLLSHPTILPKKSHLNHSLLTPDFSQNTSLTSQSTPQVQRILNDDQNGEKLSLNEDSKKTISESSSLIASETAPKLSVSKQEENETNQSPNENNKEPHSLLNPSSVSKKGTSSHVVGKTNKVKAPGFKPIKPKVDNDVIHNSILSDLNELKDECHGLQPLAPPCSIMCNGKKGMLPNLLCSRCLLLFHRECVPSGLLLDDRRFICPNCVQPSDNEMQANVSMNGNSGVDSSNPSSSKICCNKGNSNLNQSSSMVPVKPSRAYLPILPKPSSNHQMDSLNNSNTQILSHSSTHAHRSKQQQSGSQQSCSLMNENFHSSSDHHYHSNVRKPIKQAASHSSGMRLKLPAGTHLYRVSGSSNSTKSHHSSFNHTNLNMSLNRKFLKNQTDRSSHSRALMQSGKASSNYPPSIASIKIPPNQMASFIQNKASKSKLCFNLIQSDFSLLTNGYECLNSIFKQLTVRDLIKLKQVSRTFNHLASQPLLWQKIKLKGLTINDWQYLGRNIIETFGTSEVDFDGVRFSGNDEIWRNFSSIIDYLKSIKSLRFGSVPIFVIEDIINAAVVENCYNSFSNLETLEVKNMFEEDSSSKQCALKFIEQIGCLSSLKCLKLDCKHGLVLNKECGESLNSLSSLSNLKCLVLPNLKGFTVDQFEFLTHLTHLKELEIGSCESWTIFEEKTENENKKDEKVLPKEKEKNEKEKEQKEDDENDDDDDNEDNDDDEQEEKVEEEENREIKDEEDNQVKNKDSEKMNQLKGAFKYLGELIELKRLKLCDVIIDETSNQLSLSIQKMKDLESLSLDCVTISPDATQTLNFLCTTIKSHLNNLKEFSISTDDPHTNKCVFDLLKKLNNLNHIIWKVGALVEDSGECLVPFLKERGDESDIEEENLDLTSGEDNLEMADVDYLHEFLQSHLTNTRVEILPQ